MRLFEEVELEKLETFEAIVTIVLSVSRICPTKQDDYLQVIFEHFWSKRHFFEAAGAVVEICSSL